MRPLLFWHLVQQLLFQGAVSGRVKGVTSKNKNVNRGEEKQRNKKKTKQKQKQLESDSGKKKKEKQSARDSLLEKVCQGSL